MSCRRVLEFGAVLLAGLAMAGIATTAASAQASPTAVRRVDISAFVGGTGTFTGLNSGKNAGITAGIDLNLPRRFGVRPSLEVRGTTPFDRGRVDSQKDVLAGVRAEFLSGRLHPYADFLIGRGEISYSGYRTASGASIYGNSNSTVISPGVGARYNLVGNFSVFGDAQFQHWDTPVSPSGHLFAKPITAGLVYRFAYGHLINR
jgi:hypothetical protein